MANIAFLVVFLIISTPVRALEGWSTCHAAGTTGIAIAGRDTANATLRSKMTIADAQEYCDRMGTSYHGNQKKCAAHVLRTEGGSIITVHANCRMGTLSVSTGKWSMSYQLPLAEMCGNDNMAAISAFRMLCPSYSGRIIE